MKTYTQHPIAHLFPDMSTHELEDRLDGAIPSNELFYTEVAATDWFQSLRKSQRALYVAGWFHHLDTGSNQHQQIVSTKTQRYCAEAAQTLLQRVAA